MTKQEAIKMFGSGAALARVLGITRAAVSFWPEQLSQRTTDEIMGAALRTRPPLEIERMLVLSTDHFDNGDPETVEWLPRHAQALHAGWLLDTTLASYELESNPPPAIAAIIDFARRYQCDFVRFDYDAPTRPELPIFS